MVGNGRGSRARGARRSRRPTHARLPARLRRLRFQHREESYAVYGIAIHLPRNALGSAFSRAHPELRIEVINRMMVSPALILAETRISGPGPADWPAWTAEVRRFPGVEGVELQVEGPGRIVCRVIFATGLAEKVAQKHRVLARYPMVVQDGWMRFETLATSSQIRPYLAELERRVGPSRVESVRRHSVSLGSLGLTSSAGCGVPRGVTNRVLQRAASDLAEQSR